MTAGSEREKPQAEDPVPDGQAAEATPLARLPLFALPGPTEAVDLNAPGQQTVRAKTRPSALVDSLAIVLPTAPTQAPAGLPTRAAWPSPAAGSNS